MTNYSTLVVDYSQSPHRSWKDDWKQGWFGGSTKFVRIRTDSDTISRAVTFPGPRRVFVHELERHGNSWGQSNKQYSRSHHARGNGAINLYVFNAVICSGRYGLLLNNLNFGVILF